MNKAVPFVLFVVFRSFLDYAVCMWLLPIVAPFWDIYSQFLLWSGVLLFLAWRNWTPEYLIYSGVAVFFCENFFYVWVNLFGNLNGCYDWYSGNPLNPDGVFGYGWTNPMNMPMFFGHVMVYYLVASLLFGAGILLVRKLFSTANTNTFF